MKALSVCIIWYFTLFLVLSGSCVNNVNWKEEIARGAIEIAASTANCMIDKELTWTNFSLCGFEAIKSYLAKRLAIKTSIKEPSELPTDDEIADIVDGYADTGRGIKPLPNDYQQRFAEYLRKLK